MENNEIVVWRLQTNTSKGNAAEYCLKHNVAAVGWDLSRYLDRSDLKNLSFEEYCRHAEEHYRSFDSVIRMKQDIRPNHLVWMRDGGIYYIARVLSNSKWKYNDTDDARIDDVCNQITNIFWKKVGNESEVPGALTTAFIRGSAFQRIWKEGILEYSEMIYDNVSNDEFKYNKRIALNKDTFYSLISPSDCEDLLYSYLYHINEKNYMCIPSTNKISTEKYEFVSLDTRTGKHIYIQVKNGEIDLDANDYKELLESNNHDSEVYLFTSKGKRINEGVNVKIHFINPDDLFDFACNADNIYTIPPHIRSWIEFAGGFLVDSAEKGIMFDTNDNKCEQEMFDRGVIAAWGPPKRFINSFNLGDYVLYYKKGFGVIAAGKITGSEPVESNDGKELPVEMILPPKKDLSGKWVSVAADEIRKMLGKRFFYASTRKVPFLTIQESNQIISELEKKQKAI